MSIIRFFPFQVVQDKLWDAANSAGIQFHKLDKKGEKNMVQDFTAKLQEKLNQDLGCAELLSTAVPVLIAKVISS